MGVAVVLVAAAQPTWAALKSESAAEVRGDVMRLQGVVAGCAATGATACASTAVGDDLQVGDPKHGGYEVHWDWLRDALDKSKDMDSGKREEWLRDSAARLTRMASELGAAEGGQTGQKEFARARAEADAVLALPEFQRKSSTTWWDRVTGFFYAWLARMLSGIARAGAAAPWLGPVVIWTLCLSAAAGLVFFVLRSLQRQRLRISLAGAAVAKTAWDREATDWAKQAEEFANSGEWREAVHCLYWAAIVSLEARRAWRHNPTRTPREYVRLLKPGSAQQRGLRGLTQIFERVWYGLREGRAEEYAEARGLYEALASGVVERVGGADEAQRSGAAVGEGGVA
jgi:Domain of unknown function (DUF4129)